MLYCDFGEAAFWFKNRGPKNDFFCSGSVYLVECNPMHDMISFFIQAP